MTGNNAGVSSHTHTAKVLTGDVGEPGTTADAQALGPEGGLETQDNSSFIKKVADKLHLRNKHEDKHPQHRKMEGFVEAGVHGGMEEAFELLSREEYIAIITNLVRIQGRVGTETAIRVGLEVLGDSKGMQAVGKLTRAQAVILADQALSDLGRQAARVAAGEAVAGSYDAIERKYMEWARGTFVKGVVFPAAAIVAGMFGTGMMLALWRFVLFGLH